MLDPDRLADISTHYWYITDLDIGEGLVDISDRRGDILINIPVEMAPMLINEHNNSVDRYIQRGGV